MVRTIKTYEEYEALSRDTMTGIGYKYKTKAIEAAKENHFFRILKEYLMEIEDEGIEVLYYCADLPLGKELMFIFNTTDDKYANIVRNMLVDISLCKSPERKQMPDKEFFSTGASSNASCCPYFG